MIQKKSVIIGALLIAAAQLTLVAQRGGHGFPIEQMKDSLELSQDQVKQLELIRAESRELMQALRQNETMDRDSMRAKMRALRADSREKVEAVLTPEQQTKLAAMRQERGPGFDRKRGVQRGDMKGKSMDRRKRLKENQAEIRAYRAENVRPVLRAQRAKLDEKLSMADKEKISSLRASMEKKREEMRLQRQSLRKQGEKPGPDALKELRETHRNSAEMQEARALAEKYHGEIQGLLAEVQDQRNQWRSDIREIRQSGSDAGFRKTGHHRHPAARGEHRMKHHGERQAGPSMDERKERRATMERVHFLLMDPNHTTGSLNAMQAGDLVSGIEVFPNPAVDVLNLSFDLRSSVPARIELRDESGNLVKDVPYQVFEKGKASVRVELEGVPTGAYSVSVIPDGGKPQVARVVVNK